MRKIRIIALAELNNLFYSPVAWILLIIFIIQCSLAFTDAVHMFQQFQQMLKLFPSQPRSATLVVMTADAQVVSASGVFVQMVDKLYLYLPLLTMGLISREMNSGTIRLLYSSPVKTGQIVLGKFLAMAIYSLLLVVVLGIFVVTAIVGISNPDTGMLLSALLGFFLLLCAYSAIGLFMSSLTSYQVVAALSTLAVFAALHYLGSVWQGIDFVRDLTYFLSLGSRTQTLFSGMITSRDVLYFIIITVLFLGFSFFKLQADQESSSVWLRICRYAGLTVIATTMIYLTSRPGWIAYADVTAAKTKSITSVTQALLKSTGDERLEITAYVNLLDNMYDICAPQKRNTYLQFWEPYVRFKPGIKFNYVYYYDTTPYTLRMMKYYYKGKTVPEVAKEFAKTNNVNLNRFLTPGQVHAIPGLKDEKGRFVMQLKYKGRTFFLRVFNDQQLWPSESQIASALKRLIQPDIAPKIGFLEGNLERKVAEDASGDREYSSISTGKPARYSLINNGFNVETIDTGKNIPADITALVIADPKVTLSPATIGRVQKYIKGGGNLLITGEPDKQSVLNPLLKPLGVRMENGILVQQKKDEVPDMITPSLTEVAGNMSQGAAGLYNGQQSIVMPGATALNYGTGTDSAGTFKIQPLLALNGENSWLKMGKLVNDSAAVEFNAAQGDQHAKYFVPAVALIRVVNGRQQRIAITGDADFMSNISMKTRRTNPSFCVALFKWISNGALPLEPARLEIKDLNVDITDDQLTGLQILFVWVLPGLLLAAGTILLIRRKRK